MHIVMKGYAFWQFAPSKIDKVARAIRNYTAEHPEYASHPEDATLQSEVYQHICAICNEELSQQGPKHDDDGMYFGCADAVADCAVARLTQ